MSDKTLLDRNLALRHRLDRLSLPTAASFATGDITAPVLRFGGNSAGMTYGTRSGGWVRTGNFVTFHTTITLSLKGTSTGFATFSCLPQTLLTSKGNGGGVITRHFNMAGLTDALHFVVDSATDFIILRRGDTNLPLDQTFFNDNSELRISGFVEVLP